MKKLLVLISAIILAGILFISCQESPDINQPLSTQLSKIGTGSPDMFLEGVTYCGDYKVVDFWAGQTIDAGSVTIYNDATNLYVTVYSEFGFQSVDENIKMWVGADFTTLPVNGQGVPINGQFPYKVTTSGTTYTFTIPLNDLSLVNQCGDLIYIVVHGDVLASDGNGGTTAETAFGGDTPGGTGNRWWFYTTFNIQCCNGGGGGFDHEETAFAKGGWVWTTQPKSNPENLPSLNLTKNRWGWAINLTETGTTSYQIWAGAGLNNTSNGVLVGTLSVNYTGTQAIVTYNMNSGYQMKEVHIYVSDTLPTNIAPGQYGNTVYFDPMSGEYTATIDVSGSSIWIIAHSVVAW